MIFPAAGLRGLALKEAAPDLMRTINWVRDALDKSINANVSSDGRKWFELDVIYGDRAVITMGGRSWSYPYTIADGVVTIGDPQEVVETYLPIKEAAAVDGDLRMVEAEGYEAGTVWEATLIVAGISENGILYSDQVLREALPLFEGTRICIKSDEEHIKSTKRNINQVVGWNAAPRFVEGSKPDTGRVTGTLRLPGLPENTRNLLIGAVKAGKTDLVGLSIDARGKGTTRMVEGKKVRAATSIDLIESVDLIVEPGAGGRLIRLVEAAPEYSSISGDPDMKLREMMLRFIEAKAPDAYAKLDPETVSDEQLELAYREAVAGSEKKAPVIDPNSFEERVRMIEARANAKAEIAGSTLPQAAKDRLLQIFATRERFVEADVTAAIKDEREYLSRMAESGRVNLGEFGQGSVEDRSVRIRDMFDAFFDPAHKDHRNVHSFKECYVEVTGDRRVTGRLSDCDMVRMRESLGMNFREAVMDSTTFAQALGDAITRRMLSDYNAQSQYDVWRYAANVVPLNDFRTQHRIRFGGFGDLPVVNEGADYLDAAVPDDEEATYKAAKTGRLSVITMEMIRNDDVGVVRQIPVKLSRAAKRTLAKFVLDMMRTNPVIYDGVALYHATHGNLGTAALSGASWSAGRQAIMKQSEQGSNDRLGIPPRNLWVPSDLEEGAFDLFKNRNTSNDQNFIQTQAPRILPVWYWQDANDWVASCDTADVPFIEVGFLDGREEPEIFVQDNPTVGSLFNSDKITYKIRHIYGGAVTDYRGTYKAVVP
ncbi:MAG: hypothetical protein D3M94_07360 [Rhodocyclales bacterium GT-UBC]|nr:MAG: hypothetical protein D3M94_07360 [Rhodocyclales bacterium GT-UBC]